jgi:general stress protein YciG
MAEIGARGGKKTMSTRTGPFALDRELASRAGKIGGKISIRRKSK